ncbi:MAG TPA: biotin/lipoyl-containing protein [Gemmatimonadaceae bacterium]|nr:biotin/lipoyl-containing protein [Gemmatimonadaceae bacterium]
MNYIVDVGVSRLVVALEPHGVSVEGRPVIAHLADVPRTPISVLTVGDAVHSIRVRRGDGRGRYILWVGGYRFDAEALDERTRVIRDLDVERNVSSGPAPLLAPMPGLVVRVLVAEGATVQTGEGLVVMEAMKMENELRAPATAVVRRIHASAGAAVEKGALLIELEGIDA